MNFYNLWKITYYTHSQFSDTRSSFYVSVNSDIWPTLACFHGMQIELQLSSPAQNFKWESKEKAAERKWERENGRRNILLPGHLGMKELNFGGSDAGKQSSIKYGTGWEDPESEIGNAICICPETTGVK